ncbi:MAG: penicillin-binding protein 2 [Actinobacteria bacterium]|nr:penicillin-binding protein 2 [Actinomycetota bacterium]
MELTDATLDKNIKLEDIRARLVILTFIAIGIFIILISRLWFFQVMGGQRYMELAEGNYIRVVPVDAPRGLIYDRNGQVLVNNRPSIGVTISPTVAEKQPEILHKLGKILGITVDEIKDKLTEKKADPLKPRVVKRDLDDRTLAYIEEHKMELPGVDVVTESIRGYPHGSLGAHMFGYLGEISEEEMSDFKKSGGDYMLGDIIGKSGVENIYEGLLRGGKGRQHLEVNAAGRPLSVIRNEDPIPGHNLMLAIDLKIQKATEEALEEAIERARRGPGDKFKAEAGAAVVLDPRNGEIIAMASNPTFSPELFIGGISKKNWKELMAKENHYPLNNRALMAYPPGSIFKPVTMMGALEDGLVSENENFTCTGRWTGLGRKWAKRCWKRSGHHGIGLKRGMAESCDTVFYIIGHRFYKDARERLQYWSRVFGFGSRSGIDLPTETKGRVPDKKWKREFNRNNPEYQPWYPGDTVNMAIGQGDLLVTPLQIAAFYGAIANGGTFYRPHVGKAMISWDGNVKTEFKPKPEDAKRLPVSKEIIRFIQKSLESVTTQGTASGAFNGFPARVAGKTGTAQVSGKDDFAWFVGYAPAEEPRYVAVVIVEQGGHGGSTAAPAVRKILATALGYNDKGVGYVYDPSR